MHPVQEARTCHHFGSVSSRARGAAGLLEDPRGVVFLGSQQEVIGTCYYARLYQHDDDDFGQWFEWDIPYVHVTHAKAMLYLHGASPQQLFAPFVLLRANPRPAHHPVPGFDDVVLAGLPDEVLASTSLGHLFTTLSSRVVA